jgi:hypothetical protein
MPFTPMWSRPWCTAISVVSAMTPPLDTGIREVHATAARPQAGNGREVDDGAAATLEHLGDGVLAGQHHALEVDVQHPVPVFRLHLHHSAWSTNADVIHQDVQSPIPRSHGFDHSLAVRGVGHIGLVHRCVAPLLADGREGLLRMLGDAIHQEHPGALAGEEHGDGLARADSWPTGPGTGHDRHLSLQPRLSFRHNVLLSLRPIDLPGMCSLARRAESGVREVSAPRGTPCAVPTVGHGRAAGIRSRHRRFCRRRRGRCPSTTAANAASA